VPILERQPLHLVLLAVLLVGVRLLVDADPQTVSGSFLGLGAGAWLLLAATGLWLSRRRGGASTGPKMPGSPPGGPEGGAGTAA